MHMAYTRIVGSNPTVSAKLSKKAAAKRLFSFPEASEAPARFWFRHLSKDQQTAMSLLCSVDQAFDPADACFSMENLVTQA
jgi:hypothetical protein